MLVGAPHVTAVCQRILVCLHMFQTPVMHGIQHQDAASHSPSQGTGETFSVRVVFRGMVGIRG